MLTQIRKEDIFIGDKLSESCFPEKVITLKRLKEVMKSYEEYKDVEGYKKFIRDRDCITECLSFIRYLRDKISPRGWRIKDWNDWLFKYCFEEGIEQVK